VARLPFFLKMDRIYLDHNATTPLDPRVLEAMRPWLEGRFGNASSLHWFGQRARAAVEDARTQVAALVGATPAEIVFASGGTEADNLALRGAAAAAPPPRRKILVSAVEHPAVLNAAKALLASGFTVELVRVTPEGRLDLEDLRARVDETTALVSVMLANNETGVLQPVAEAAALARARGALVHCDAVQAAGKVAVDVDALGCDLLSLSAHKIYGPQGVGALYVRRGTPMEALLRGGSQERNRRAGTENVTGAVGFGSAAEIARAELDRELARLAGLRDQLEERLLRLAGAQVNGGGPRVPTTTNVSFAGAEAEGLLMALDLAGIAVSTGAACAAGAAEPSHVLLAMGLPRERVQASLRFSLGRGSSGRDLERSALEVESAVARHRAAARSSNRR
jgi:cysteine desulfurase